MMKKIIFIFVIATLLFATCKKKEERLIIGEWKLIDIKETLSPTITRHPLWADYLYDSNKSLTITFNRKKISEYDITYKLIKKTA